jgi:hypothetical protein
MSHGRDAAYGAAIALALAGDDSLAQSVAVEFDKRYPDDTLIQFHYLPTLRAILAGRHGNFSKGVELLEATAPYELGSQNSLGFSPSLYPIYFRGTLYLAARQGPQAAVEFEKIQNHRGIVMTDPIGALARLQLGRAHALSGHTAQAQAAYQDFLTLWKDADADIPILRQAKTEYANLR